MKISVVFIVLMLCHPFHLAYGKNNAMALQQETEPVSTVVDYEHLPAVENVHLAFQVLGGVLLPGVLQRGAHQRLMAAGAAVMIISGYLASYLVGQDHIVFMKTPENNPSEVITGDVFLSLEDPQSHKIPPWFPALSDVGDDEKDKKDKKDKEKPAGRLARDVKSLDIQLKNVHYEAQLLEEIQTKGLELYAFKKGVAVSDLTDEEKKDFFSHVNVDYLADVSEATLERIHAQLGQLSEEMQALKKNGSYNVSPRMHIIKKYLTWLGGVCGTVLLCIGLL
ncbi:MAG: hypothetical protein OXC44_06840 [Proteobacteria bacterium]|nr:hypothetical protein [Pseudomonadota bacterium]